MTEPTTEQLDFEGIKYWLRIPKDAQSRQNELRILVSMHGTNGNAKDYLDIVTDPNDDDRYGLVVVAPQFLEGAEFDFPESDSHRWLHELLHQHLPDVLAARGLSVYTDKVYFFGHSRGGQLIHVYMLKYYSEDVLGAAICGPGLLRPNNRNPLNMPDYLDRLKAFVQANVAIIIGTSDCANKECLTDSSMDNQWNERNVCGDSTGDQQGRPKWQRIREVIDYFNNELAPLLGEAYMKCIIQQQPPEWHPDGAFFPIPAGPATNPVCNKRIRFFWTPNLLEGGKPVQGHRGWRNYPTARQYLFESSPMLCPTTEVERHDWTSGWTTAEFYTVGGATYLFLLKSGDGTVHVQQMNADGTVGARVKDYDWTSGWTTAKFYTAGGATYLFLLKTSDGTMHIHRMNPDGTVGAQVEARAWTSGWTTAGFYTVGSDTYLFLQKASDGAAHIHRINSDGTIGTQVDLHNWTSGWTTAKFYTIGGVTYLFLLKASDGTVHIHRIKGDGTVGAQIQTHAWSGGWTTAEFYTVGGVTYLFLLKAGDGTVHTQRMNVDGTVGDRVSVEAQEHDWPCGWTTAKFCTVGGATLLFLLSRSSGMVHIHKIPI